MRLLTSPKLSPESKCPYLEDKLERHEFFFADELKQEEMDFLLSKGWRKFAQFLFRPSCAHCKKCLPLRVDVKTFKPSKSQRRNIKKNHDITVKHGPLKYKNEHFALFKKHSYKRFDKSDIENERDFVQTFFIDAGTGYLSEFYLDHELVAYGILDRTDNALSSVYFVFDPEYENRGLGIFGAICEIEQAKLLELDYYYLGYWIEENKSMRYKNSFKPHELYDWDSKTWTKA
ncbi:MAG: arginyltransferase [Bdellovibrionota bacterium]|nr:arginyltransferase [Bdellovibrionota bacterium]